MTHLMLAAAATKSLATPKITYLAILPVLVLLGGATAMLGASALTRRTMSADVTTGLAVTTALVALGLSIGQWIDVSHHGAHVTVDGAVVQDGFSALVSILVCCAVFIAALVGDTWIRREAVAGPEMHVLMLVSASGAVMMGLANDLIVVFLGLEILSIALYVLTAFDAKRSESGEAGLKYFVLGGFSSAIFVYGIALVYGATGTTNLPQIADYLARNVLLHDGLLLAGMALLLVGFGFKVAAVPFHLWTPDVYQGAPTPITGFMAAVAKAGGFAAFLRVFISSFGIMRSDWQPAIWVIAALTLVLGASAALVQRDVKRMLAYSSINHAGFVLIGLQAATSRGVEASLYYLFTYTFLALGSFAVITIVGGVGDGGHDLERYRGLARRAPFLAGAFAVFLVAQAGVPFTTGFLAKLEVVSASVGAGSTALAVVAMVSAAMAVFFYLRVVLLMYGTGPGGVVELPAPMALVEGGGAGATHTALAEVSTAADLHVPAATAVSIVLCLGVTVLFGLWPAPLVDFAHGARLLF